MTLRPTDGLAFLRVNKRQAQRSRQTWDPRCAEFDDVDYRDVLGAYRSDPDEPRSTSEYFAGRYGRP